MKEVWMNEFKTLMSKSDFNFHFTWWSQNIARIELLYNEGVSPYRAFKEITKDYY